MYSITIPSTPNASIRFYGTTFPTYVVETDDAIAFTEFMGSYVMPHIVDGDLLAQTHTLIAKAIVASPQCVVAASAALVFIDEVEFDSPVETAWLERHDRLDRVMVNLG